MPLVLAYEGIRARGRVRDRTGNSRQEGHTVAAAAGHLGILRIGLGILTSFLADETAHRLDLCVFGDRRPTRRDREGFWLGEMVWRERDAQGRLGADFFIGG